MPQKVRATAAHTAEAIERLAYWMRSEDPRASPAACSALLARGWGQPGQTMSLEVDGALKVEAMTPEQRLAEASALLAEIGRLSAFNGS